MNDQIFRKTDPFSLPENAFNLIGKKWFLLSAGSPSGFNVMTASWGGMGVLWNKPVVFVFVRPTRHTFGFMEQSGIFTLSFLDEQYRKILNYCGSKSGRDVDKIARTGLVPIPSERGSIYYEQASLVMECRKLYSEDIHPQKFIDPAIEKNYPLKDYHRMYVGEIINCLEKINR